MAPRHMTQEQKQMARRLKAKGLTLKEIARDLSCSLVLVLHRLRPAAGNGPAGCVGAGTRSPRGLF